MNHRFKGIKKGLCVSFAFTAAAYLPQATPAVTSSSLGTPSHMTQQVWNLKNADIRAIIQTVSMLTGKPFIIDPRVQGNVTFVSQNPMSLDELYSAFLSMLQVLNYSAVPSSNGVIKIVPSVDANSMGGKIASRYQPGQGDELVVRIVQINNVSATQLVPVLRPLMPQWASVSAYTPSNSLILAGNAGDIKRLVRMVRQMDSKNANDMVIVTLKHASAKNVVSIINKLEASDRMLGKSPNVSLAADETSNSVLISGNLSNISRMRLLINQLDSQSKNGGSDTKVIFLNYLDAKKLAPILTKIAQGSLKASPDIGGSTATPATSSSDTTPNLDNGVSIQAEPDSDNAIIIRAPHGLMVELTNIIKHLDKEPQQVLVEAIIVKVDEALLNQLGIVWGTVSSDGSSTVINPNDPNAVTNNITQNFTSPANTFALKLNGGIGFINNGNLQALIHALKSNGSTDILATPSIVVLNNQKATISDGKNVGITNRIYQSSAVVGSGSADQALGTPFNTIQRTDVTLSLTVTPQISPNSYLRLNIKQQDDSLEEETTTDATQDNPTINTSKINTNVLVHSGDILVLGGLIQHATKQTITKVPILGDIPLLGRLFTYTNNVLDKQNLMIFLKPVILRNRALSRRQTLERYRYIRGQQFLARENKPLTKELMPVLPSSTTVDNTHRPFLPKPQPTYHSLLPAPQSRCKQHHCGKNYQ